MARKIHGRTRRYSRKGPQRYRAKRLKTFLDENQAKLYAEKLKLKNYKIVKANYGLSKKYKIVLEK